MEGLPLLLLLMCGVPMYCGRREMKQKKKEKRSVNASFFISPKCRHAFLHVSATYLSVTRVTLGHHRRGLESGVGDLSHRQPKGRKKAKTKDGQRQTPAPESHSNHMLVGNVLLVVSLLGRDDRGVRRQHEVDTEKKKKEKNKNDRKVSEIAPSKVPSHSPSCFLRLTEGTAPSWSGTQ